MRVLIAASVLASACFSPSTASCVYQCSAAANACPAGLTCFDGMCKAAADEQCTVADDAAPDSSSIGCDDGVPAPGEICFGAPRMLEATSSSPPGPSDAQFIDVNNDDRLDLVWVDGLTFGIHTQAVDGELAGMSVAGPPTQAVRMAIVQIGSDYGLFTAAHNETAVWAYDPAANAFARAAHALAPNGLSSPLAIEVGAVTAADGADVVVRHQDQLVAYRFANSGANGMARNPNPVPVGDTLGIADLNSDGFEDVLISDGPGIRVLAGANVAVPLPLGNPMPTIVTNADRLTVRDMNGDGREDVVFTTTDGNIGISLATGAGHDIAAPSLRMAGPLLGGIAVTDVDGDGDPDVLVGAANPTRLLIARGGGDGTVAAPVEIPLAFVPTVIRADVDYNGDRINDIVVLGGREVAVLTSNP